MASSAGSKGIGVLPLIFHQDIISFHEPGLGIIALISHVFGSDYPTHDGTGVRDFIHVVDLAKGHIKACAYAFGHTGSEIINLGTGHGYSVLDLVNTFTRVNGVAVPYEFAPRRPGDIAENYADPSKAERLLGWKAEKNLEDMCRDTYRFQLNNPKGYAGADS